MFTPFPSSHTLTRHSPLSAPLMVHPLCRLRYHCLVSFLLALWGSVLGVNRTIDDKYGDSVTGRVPEYLPSSWQSGDTCSGCHVQLDHSQCHNGTWRDKTFNTGDEPTFVRVQFNGTAVYVYHILAPQIPGSDTRTNLSFTLDGVPDPTSYLWNPTASDPGYRYNELVYANTNLINAQHTLEIHLVGAVSLALFDYIVYNFEDNPSVRVPFNETVKCTADRSTLPTPLIAN